MKYLGKIEDGKDLVNKEYVDDNAYVHPTTHDISMITDLSSDNVFKTDKSMSGLMYFKNNNITNISQVYKTGLYGTKNTDTTTPYAGYWFVIVFCKDEVNQIAVQWAMPVSKIGNGELWIRTVRLNAASTADGNMVGTWKQLLNADGIPIASTTILGGVKVDGTTITADANGVISSNGGSGGGVIISSTEPIDTSVLWVDTGNNGITKYHNGSSWMPIASTWG